MECFADKQRRYFTCVKHKTHFNHINQMNTSGGKLERFSLCFGTAIKKIDELTGTQLEKMSSPVLAGNTSLVFIALLPRICTISG